MSKLFFDLIYISQYLSSINLNKKDNKRLYNIKKIVKENNENICENLCKLLH